MRRGILIALLAAFVLAGCGGATVVRDAKVYKTELTFWEQASIQTADALAGFIAEHCTCDAEGEFMTPTCLKAAKKVLVVRTRVPYHHQMALYNAGLLEKRPPKNPPVVPSTSTLCPPIEPDGPVTPPAPVE